jgi:hypothetical protein
MLYHNVGKRDGEASAYYNVYTKQSSETSFFDANLLPFLCVEIFLFGSAAII